MWNRLNTILRIGMGISGIVSFIIYMNNEDLKFLIFAFGLYIGSRIEYIIDTKLK
jgi:hypothetical protein